MSIDTTNAILIHSRMECIHNMHDVYYMCGMSIYHLSRIYRHTYLYMPSLSPMRAHTQIRKQLEHVFGAGHSTVFPLVCGFEVNTAPMALHALWAHGSVYAMELSGTVMELSGNVWNCLHGGRHGSVYAMADAGHWHNARFESWRRVQTGVYCPWRSAVRRCLAVDR